MTGGTSAVRLDQLGYSQAELDEMSKEDLLLLYKSSGCQELKWPLALRYGAWTTGRSGRCRGSR